MNLTLETPRGGTLDWDYPVWLTPKKQRDKNVNSEIKFYSQFISEGEVVVDVGAHMGDNSVAFSVCAGKSGTVIALEPNPATFKILAEHAFRNRKYGNIVPIPLAVHPNITELTIDYGDHWLDNGGFHGFESPWSHGSNYPIPCNAVNLGTLLKDIDSINQLKVSFIKLDCEGLDLSIIEDFCSRGLSSGQKPIFQFEILELNESALQSLQNLSVHFCFYEINIELCELRLFSLAQKPKSVLNSRDFLAIPLTCGVPGLEGTLT